MNKTIIALAILLIIGCSSSPDLDGVDTSKWKADHDGCENYRISVVDKLIEQSKDLKGLSQNQVTDILGKADQHELYERSQKFFIYHLEPGKNCPNYDGNYFKALYIRFNSLGQAVAFTVQEIK